MIKGHAAQLGLVALLGVGLLFALACQAGPAPTPTPRPAAPTATLAPATPTRPPAAPTPTPATLPTPTVATVASPTPPPPTPTTAPAPVTTTAPVGGDVSAGKTVFDGRCTACHPGGQAGVGPSLVGISTRMTDQQITDTIRRGRGMMPAFPPAQVSDAQLADIIAFLKSLK